MTSTRASVARRRDRERRASELSTPVGGVDIDVRDVFKRYGPIEALRGVSMQISASEFVTITGPSGSGKSTLLNMIGSLDKPDRGTISVGGVPVPEPHHAVQFRRSTVGFVFQDYVLLPYLTAQDNVGAALLATGLGRHARRQRSLELLAEVGLADRARHLPAELSGGQRQAVALARALANDPCLLLADEPTGSLDSDSGQRALDLFARLRDSHGMTVIVVSHDSAVANRADRVVRLADGHVISS
jgi:putative ABC transport system ATP-binding protein